MLTFHLFGIVAVAGIMITEVLRHFFTSRQSEGLSINLAKELSIESATYRILI